jgi:ATP-dependent Clp protease ATP-binding subunit ClpA
VFERFTEEAKYAMAAAMREAHALEHGRIGTEHLLLGCVHASEAVKGAVPPIDELRAEVRRLGEVTPRQGPPQFTPRARQALEFTIRSRHVWCGAARLARGFLRQPDSGACETLRALGVDVVDVDTSLDHAVEFPPFATAVYRAMDPGSLQV